MKLKSIFYSLLIASLTSTAYAQVKIGSNPGTIGATSNLEVEAANGYKTSVDKTSGKVTIVDGSQGDGKILTSDANGIATWKSQGGQTGTGFDSYLSASGPFTINYNQGVAYPFPATTITEAGTYMAVIRTFGEITNPAKAVAFYSTVFKNGAQQDTFEWYAAPGDNGRFGVSGTLIFNAAVGDVITIGFSNGYANQAYITISSTYLDRNNVRFVKIR